MKIQKGLSAPLDGMSTAFSSSLFGLAGSLILGFLDLQVGQLVIDFLMNLKIGFHKWLFLLQMSLEIQA